MSVQKWSLVWPVMLSIVIPLVVSWFHYPIDHLPPGFGIFPPQMSSIPKAAFNLLVFIVIAGVGLGVIAFILCPSWFGFQGGTPGSSSPKKTLPWWFWLGLVTTLFFWWVMWARPQALGSFVFYAFSPMWWGFIIMMDGIVYHRMNGKSMIVNKTGPFIFSAVISVAGWGYFEFYDYFVLSNWYYPNGTMPGLSHSTIVLLFIVAYTTVWPAIFQWLNLLQSWPKMMSRYQNGWKVPLPVNALMLVGFILLGVMVIWPDQFFWAIWIGPLIIITAALIKAGIWNPFTAMGNGDWTGVVLVALASLFNGFLWEMWNHGSESPDIGYATNPNYWVYDIPYVNVIHIFSEMPLLGYLGYMPFGLLVWVFFIWVGELFNVDTDLNL